MAAKEKTEKGKAKRMSLIVRFNDGLTNEFHILARIRAQKGVEEIESFKMEDKATQ